MGGDGCRSRRRGLELVNVVSRYCDSLTTVHPYPSSLRILWWLMFRVRSKQSRTILRIDRTNGQLSLWNHTMSPIEIQWQNADC